MSELVVVDARRHVWYHVAVSAGDADWSERMGKWFSPRIDKRDRRRCMWFSECRPANESECALCIHYERCAPARRTEEVLADGALQA